MIHGLILLLMNRKLSSLHISVQFCALCARATRQGAPPPRTPGEPSVHKKRMKSEPRGEGPKARSIAAKRTNKATKRKLWCTNVHRRATIAMQMAICIVFVSWIQIILVMVIIFVRYWFKSVSHTPRRVTPEGNPKKS